MKINSEKGYSVIDIATALVVLFIFISVLSILFYNFNSTSNEVKLKSEASSIAVEEIEKIKNIPIDSLYEQLEDNNILYGNNDESAESQEIQKGFYRKIIIEDYSQMDSEKMPGFVKKVTVKIQYKLKKELETIELSTIISKEK